ncbi:cytochrome-c peroxidase [Acidisoma sp.]|uniref:cytochrome-c peroxidase n=1 Tax=Acidisoma sp. TaxID=1872115 RepID=UPI003B0012D6
MSWRGSAAPTIALLALLTGVTSVAALLCGPVPLSDWLSDPHGSLELTLGKNPAPVELVRPDAGPMSLYAQLGKQIFFDPSFSSSGQLDCSSCHSPDHFYAPSGAGSAMSGGPALARQGARAVPSLMYLPDPSVFSIGPDPAGEEAAPVALPQLAVAAQAVPRATKTAQSTAQSAANIVPEGGLFWDGRVNTLQAQALGPLFSPFEMDGGTVRRVAARLRTAPYAGLFIRINGPEVFDNPSLTVSEAAFALARYQVEDPSFHPYTSKYDAWLEGHARLSWAETRGYMLFNDPAKGDCAACHLDQPSPEGQPPLFTDQQFEALGVPRNPDLIRNREPGYFDLGLCGPYRTDLAAQTQYCGMFLTPTLRNTAARRAFFHNGVYHDLQRVLDFYNFRDTAPGRIYPVGDDGQVAKYDDLPVGDRANVDTADPPFDRSPGQAPALTSSEEADIIAFLKTLTDGFALAR